MNVISDINLIFLPSECLVVWHTFGLTQLSPHSHTLLHLFLTILAPALWAWAKLFEKCLWDMTSTGARTVFSQTVLHNMYVIAQVAVFGKSSINYWTHVILLQQVFSVRATCWLERWWPVFWWQCTLLYSTSQIVNPMGEREQGIILKQQPLLFKQMICRHCLAKRILHPLLVTGDV